MGCGLLTYLREHYNYYRAPEGTDPVGKIVGLGQYGLVVGTSFAIYDACLWSHAATAGQFLNVLGFWVVPLTGMCAAFSTVTYSLTRFRNKDDKVNYIGGALASGSVFHAWTKSPRYSGWMTAFLVLYATLKKQAVLDGQSTAIIITRQDEVINRKSLFPWRTLENRNYSSKPWFEHDKTDYYVNHY